jgi:hypothetical protein
MPSFKASNIFLSLLNRAPGDLALLLLASVLFKMTASGLPTFLRPGTAGTTTLPTPLRKLLTLSFNYLLDPHKLGLLFLWRGTIVGSVWAADHDSIIDDNFGFVPSCW